MMSRFFSLHSSPRLRKACSCLLRTAACFIGYGFSAATSAGDMQIEIADAIHRHHISQPRKEDVLVIQRDRLNTYLQTLDPYSAYLNPAEFLQIRQMENAEYSGIGVEVVREKRGILLIPFSGGPACKAGIQSPELLLAIDGRATQHMALAEVGRLLTGSPGTSVGLEVSHPLGQKRRKIKLVRERFRPKPVEEIAIAGHGVIRIRRFATRRTVFALNAAAFRSTKNGGTVILDLRQCMGGDLHEALDAVSLFLPGGKRLATTVRGSGAAQDYYSLPGRPLPVKSLLVLIGPATASAAEVFVAALTHYTHAVVVGQKTLGKCTSQTYIKLSDGSALKLTNLKILNPRREFCNGQGLTPDVAVTDEELYETAKLISKGILKMRQSPP